MMSQDRVYRFRLRVAAREKKRVGSKKVVGKSGNKGKMSVRDGAEMEEGQAEAG